MTVHALRRELVRTLVLAYAREEGYLQLPPTHDPGDVQAGAFRREGWTVARMSWNTTRIPRMKA